MLDFMLIAQITSKALLRCPKQDRTLALHHECMAPKVLFIDSDTDVNINCMCNSGYADCIVGGHCRPYVGSDRARQGVGLVRLQCPVPGTSHL